MIRDKLLSYLVQNRCLFSFQFFGSKIQIQNYFEFLARINTGITKKSFLNLHFYEHNLKLKNRFQKSYNELRYSHPILLKKIWCLFFSIKKYLTFLVSDMFSLQCIIFNVRIYWFYWRQNSICFFILLKDILTSDHC